MQQDDKPCLFCGDACEVYRRAQHSYTEYVCPNCKGYAISDFFKLPSTKTLSAMYYFILHFNRREGKYLFFVRDASVFTDDAADYIDNKMLENIYPKNLNDRVDMVMLNLSTKIRYLGSEFTLPDVDDTSAYDKVSLFYHLFFVDDSNSQVWEFEKQVDEMMRILQEYDYIKHLQALGDNENSYTFTANGWNHISDLQSKNDEFPQAFIAMWFSPEMNTARVAIIKAIEDSGYIPIIIDVKEHNNQIVPEIFFEIQKSKFMIADLTGHRNGVYYEAGYAQALGKEVILTCRDTAFEERHFDIAQKNTIRWENEDDLYNRLMSRIEATIGKRN